MKSRDLGALVFGLAGLYSLLLALIGLSQLLPALPRSGQMIGGQLQIQAALVGGVVSLLLHATFGLALLAGRRALAGWLVAPAEEAAGAPTTATAEGAAATGPALGVAVAGVCALAILLLSRIVTAASYSTWLLFTRNSQGDLFGYTAAGVAVDLLLVVAGLWLLSRRLPVAAALLGPSPAAAAAGRGDRRDPGDRDEPGEPRDRSLAWQLPALRFLGLAILVWYLPALASALGVLVKWQARPMGFNLRQQAFDQIPGAATGILAGLYFLLLFPRGLGPAWRRLRPAAPPAIDFPDSDH